MIYLLDTNILLWWLLESPSMPNIAWDLIGNRSHRFFFSAASLWEIGIKQEKGKLQRSDNMPEIAMSEGFEPMSVTPLHAVAASTLPLLHKDPFDRMLVAQAFVEGVVLLTHDKFLGKYGPMVQVI